MDPVLNFILRTPRVNVLCSLARVYSPISLLRRGPFVSQEGWEKEKESVRGTMGRGKREERPPSRLFPLPIVPCALYIFRLLLFLLGYPAGPSTEERAPLYKPLSMCRPKGYGFWAFDFVRLVRLNYHYTGSFVNITSNTISKSPNEMHF